MPDKKEPEFDVQRQAIIVIHGIGEQRPMDTLRDFVQSIAPPVPLAGNADAHEPPKRKFFNKPDALSETFELRRLTASEHARTFKTDYFEYYWAYKMSGTKLSDIGWWMKEILWRPRRNIPPRIRWIYSFFWSGMVLALLATLTYFADKTLELNWKNNLYTWLASVSPLLPKLLTISKVLLPLVWAVISFFLIYFLGDAVRYMTPRTGNIEQRQDIRQTGIELLTRLHEAKIEVPAPRKTGDSPTPDKPAKRFVNKYDRIILVGHSLGSVIAYDLIKFLWTRQNELLKLTKTQLEAIEDAADKLNTDPTETNRNAYREKQFELWASQYQSLGSWRISDFITLGSPLAHAELLLASSPADLQQKQEEREYPTCPPTPETGKKFTFFSYQTRKTALHHAAPFALTRWTNITFAKDFVGGNIDAFGHGVENHYIAAEAKALNKIPFLSHVAYWNSTEPKTIDLIRSKLQLRINKKSATNVGTNTQVDKD
ncbi:hypothetical protein [Emticicia sp. TH156]|uniref:hypothetical protein n=1 Tax=Emticicia sp. TH156 TaxID=2067454 RepID=UPI000C758B48|nr:hypothetical protein [Emticicia sp. TH156]PLK44354.1 hypothetical protein C0V77_11225 [Emticicia sp. TH156]